MRARARAVSSDNMTAADEARSPKRKAGAAAAGGAAANGVKRNSKQQTQQDSIFLQLDGSGKVFFLCLAVVGVCSLATRLHKVLEPQHVCWDETHFGKMANWYLNNTFFFDVHPPLGKMLIALSGHLTGYNGTFGFENPGHEYNGTKYEGMRIFCTTMGAFLPPLTAISVWNLTGSLVSAIAAGIMLTLDTGMIALTQYILLDSPLLFFISLTSAFCTWGFSLDDDCANGVEGAQRKWWIAYSCAGISLACAIGVKFVGLFVVLWAGSFTIFRLWNYLATGEF